MPQSKEPSKITLLLSFACFLLGLQLEYLIGMISQNILKKYKIFLETSLVKKKIKQKKRKWSSIQWFL